MQCKEVELVLEQEGFSPLPQEARSHVAECPACRGLVADFNAMVEAARSIPAEVEPPAGLWVSLRAQLEAEGIIKSRESEVSVERLPWWRNFGGVLLGRALATATLGVVILAAAVFQLQQVQDHSGDYVARQPNTTHLPFAATAAALRQQESDLAKVQIASNSSVDTSLKQSMAIVDQFIQDCEQRVQTEPQDDLAREYLSGAYQQKADLLAAMMERGGSAY